jgi:hypothetical protein
MNLNEILLFLIYLQSGKKLIKKISLKMRNINITLHFLHMKKTSNIKKILIISSIILTAIYSCEDDNVINSIDQQNLQSSKDYLLIEKTIIDIEREIETGFIATGTTNNLPYYTRLNTDTADQDTLIIDFSEENYLHLGQLKRGEIIIIYNAFIYDSGAITTTSFNNFYINNRLIQGNMSSENMGPNIIGNYVFNLNIDSLSINTENGTINLDANYNKELISGYSTKYQYLDNIYLTSGFGTGNSGNGNNFEMTITDSLMITNSCFENSGCIITKGKSIITPNGYQDRILDYGDSLCDCKIDVEANNNNYLLIVN